MKKTIITLFLAIFIISMAPAAGPGGGSVDSSALLQVLSSIPASPLSAAERDGIVYMREEEKLARDVYNHLSETWGLPIFGNIAQSEQTHMNSLAVLLERYGLDDPVGKDTPGVFSNQNLQELYKSLTAAGDRSLDAALAVGAEIEDLDIFDLRKSIEGTDNDDLKIVYLNLEKGSRNHLRSFYGQLTRRNGNYEARHITAEYMERILSGNGERSGIIADPDYIY